MGASGSGSTKERLQHLMTFKGKLEAQINACGQILAQNGNVGMHGSLLDEDNYPRSDIDIYQVRLARQRIICLQNDHKDLMTEIESLLHRLHAEQRAAAARIAVVPSTSTQVPQQPSTSLYSNGNNRPNGPPTLRPKLLAPFIVINFVSNGSPADIAGLQSEDKITQFGSLNETNYNKDLKSIALLAKRMQDQKIVVKFIRNGEQRECTLVPRNWSGRGLLGCNVLPIEPQPQTS